MWFKDILKTYTSYGISISKKNYTLLLCNAISMLRVHNMDAYMYIQREPISENFGTDRVICGKL